VGSGAKPQLQTYSGIFCARKLHLAATFFTDPIKAAVLTRSARTAFKKVAEHRSGAFQLNLSTVHASNSSTLFN